MSNLQLRANLSFKLRNCFSLLQSLPGDLHSGRAFDSGCQCVLDRSNSFLMTPPRCTCSVSDVYYESAGNYLNSSRAKELGFGIVMEDKNLRCMGVLGMALWLLYPCTFTCIFRNIFLMSYTIHIHVCPQAPRLSAQYAFVSFLGSICRKMIKHLTRELRSESNY